jgi:hypothetical protein
MIKKEIKRVTKWKKLEKEKSVEHDLLISMLAPSALKDPKVKEHMDKCFKVMPESVIKKRFNLSDEKFNYLKDLAAVRIHHFFGVLINEHLYTFCGPNLMREWWFCEIQYSGKGGVMRKPPMKAYLL